MIGHRDERSIVAGTRLMIGQVSWVVADGLGCKEDCTTQANTLQISTAVSTPLRQIRMISRSEAIDAEAELFGGKR